MCLGKIKTELLNQHSYIGVVGLGYVGLPLVCVFSKKYKVIGFDINKTRIAELKDGIDITLEVDKEALLNKNIIYTYDPKDLNKCSVIIVAVPTPIDQFKKPDLSLIESAARIVGKNMSKGCVVVFESTVYPGVTEDICGKILSEESGFVLNKDFWLGYSPERVNPGDKEHTIDKIVKVVSGSTVQVTNFLYDIYSSVISAGAYKAENIKTAEAAKVIENTQRDLNIALINELALIFDKIGLNTIEVLNAAKTKWNFLPFTPGLVGGHCIGVDPYYLTYLAEGLGYHPQAILAGRRINDNMGIFIAQKAIKLILNHYKQLNSNIKVLIMGASFKENITDVRNTRVVDIVNELSAHNVQTYVFDPVANKQEFEYEYKINLENTWDNLPKVHALILAVPHNVFKQEYSVSRLASKLYEAKIILDVKSVLPKAECLQLNINLWQL